MDKATDASGRWDAAKARLAAELAPSAFDFFIKPLTLVSLTATDAVIGAPTGFMRQYVRDHFGGQIARFLGHEAGPARVTFVTLAGQLDPVHAPEPAAAPIPVASVPEAELASDAAGIGQPLNPRYSFSDFVVGRPNKFAHDAALGLAEQAPHARFNLLFLYGGSGLGKTHLMHAIGNEIRRRRPELKVTYLSAERFMNGFLRALRDKSTLEFKEVLRGVDVLLLDDVQFLAGKEYTQEEFFYAFNDLLAAGKIIVITADKSARALDLSERVKSRLAGGLEADIHPTDFELRLSVLRHRTEAAQNQGRKLDLGEDVLRYLAQKIVSNVRELEGAFNKLAVLAEATGERITVDRAREFLADILRLHDRKVSVEEIQKRVADYYNVRHADMLSPRRARAVARPRQIAMYFAKRLTTRSLPEIGRRFGGRDHTTVIHAIRRIEDLRSTDSSLDEELTKLQRMIEE
jgi:chromosomal replication initiator protein